MGNEILSNEMTTDDLRAWMEGFAKGMGSRVKKLEARGVDLWNAQKSMQKDIAGLQSAVLEMAREINLLNGRITNIEAAHAPITWSYTSAGLIGEPDAAAVSFDEVPPDRQCVDCGAHILPSACDGLHRCHPCARKYLKAELARVSNDLRSRIAGLELAVFGGTSKPEPITPAHPGASESKGGRSIADKFRQEGCGYRISGTQCALLGAERCNRRECPLPMNDEQPTDDARLVPMTDGCDKVFYVQPCDVAHFVLQGFYALMKGDQPADASGIITGVPTRTCIDCQAEIREPGDTWYGRLQLKYSESGPCGKELLPDGYLCRACLRAVVEKGDADA